MVKAPFNFVPLSGNVFFPKWGKLVSQDIPFKDGLDGTIALTVIAKTPIFIRNGSVDKNSDNTFCHTPDGTYFIPATSVKGCIRNVLEIMSFCKMKPISSNKNGYKNSPEDLELKRQSNSALNQSVSQDQLDLAECIFGIVDDDNGVRGRVQFSNFRCVKPVKISACKELHYILNTPNPACLPLYVQESVDYNDNNDSHNILNGWKRYVLKESADSKAAKEKTEKNKKMLSTIQPLNKGSVFKGKIHYHNLLPEELGALLCALTWNENENVCFHQIGQAKPYGYGQIQVSIENLAGIGDEYISKYQNMMDEWLLSIGEEDSENGPWFDAMSIYELLTLSSEQVKLSDKRFRYMYNEDIKRAKDSGERLKLFSEIIEE